MSIPTVHTVGGEGKHSLKALQKAFSDGKVVTEFTDTNGNVKYTNQSLDLYVVPLLKHLNLSVSVLLF